MIARVFVGVRLRREALDFVDAAASVRGVTRSEMIRVMLAEYATRHPNVTNRESAV